MMNVFKTMSFNPRIRKGCDSASIAAICSFTRFNPRIRKGCDTDIFV